VDRQHDGRGDRHGDRLEVLERIVGDRRIERRIDHEVRAVDQERVAVGRRLRGAAGADVAAGAADVLDIELLAHLLGQLRRDHPREQVGRAAGCERNDHAHRSRRVALRPRDAWGGEPSGGGAGEAQEPAAGERHWRFRGWRA